MDSKTEKIHKSLNALLKEAFEMISRFHEENQVNDSKKADEETPLIMRYNKWYSSAILVIKQLLPDRLTEFTELYQIPRRDNKNITYLNFTISDYFLGLTIRRNGEEVVDRDGAFLSKFQQQYSILYSTEVNLNSILNNIKGVLQADFYDSEVQAARELAKNGHIRAAGAICGVTLERHLNLIIKNHNLSSNRKHPTIADYIEILKSAQIIDTTNWRFLQRLADIRNLCAHHKDRDPKPDEVQELIGGVDKVVKTLI